jgi:outer membrane protein assembly factor BamE (lipoprotein component of BamABCDE complex)
MIFPLMKTLKYSWFVVALVAVVFAATGCDRNAFGGSKLTRENFDKVVVGMQKPQVEKILGTPTTIETTDMMIFKKTTWRYEEGDKFALVNFKNDEVEGKDSNLGR